MTAVTFDTLAAAKRLRDAGLDAKTAESIISEISTAQVELFTKQDGAFLKRDMEAMENRLKVSAAAYLFGAAGLFSVAQVILKQLGWS